MSQFFSNHKNLADFLNFYKLLMKQVFKVLNHFIEAFLSSVFSDYIYELCCIHIEQHVFSVLIFTAHFFYLHCHKSKIVEFQSELNSIRVLFQVQNLINKNQSIFIILYIKLIKFFNNII